MKKPLIALAMGTFGLGMSEFMLMGILPFIAKDFHISIPEAGHFISAYALGVCFGAPAVAVFLRKWPLKRLLYLLVSIMVAMAAAMSLCPTPPASANGTGWQFWLMMLFRFIAGTPHGAYFGTAAIIADRVSKEDKSTFAVAIMCSGMTVANLIGIPLGTFISNVYSWRWVFGFTCICDILTLGFIMRWIPQQEALPNHGIRSEFRFLKTLAPWLIVLATVFGNGGVFCWYSYISPTLTQLSGIPESWLTGMMVLAGGGMVIGNLMGGKLSDIFSPGKTGRGIETVICLGLLTIAFTAQYSWCLIPLMVITCGSLFAVSSPQQLLLIRYSKGGELLGGAMIQLAFNFGNAVGAYLGGLPIIEGNPATYHYPAAIGALLAFIGIICYSVFCNRYERE